MNDYTHIAFMNIAVYENTAWFCNLGYHALFQLDLGTGRLKLLAFFPVKETHTGRVLYSPIVYFAGKLYIAPRNGRDLLVYDLKTCLFTSIELDFDTYGDEISNSNLFDQAEEIRGKIYFFPGRFHAIAELDPVSFSVSYIADWYDVLSKNFLEEDKKKVIFNRIHIGADGNCILPCWRSQDIMKINVSTRKYEIIRAFSVSERSLSDAIEINGDILFSFKDDRGLGSVKQQKFFDLSAMGFQYTQGVFLEVYGEWIYLVPRFGEAILRYHSTTGVRERVYAFPDHISYDNEWIPYKSNSLLRKEITYNRLAVFSTFEGKFVLVDMGTGQVQRMELVLSNEDKVNINKYFIYHQSDKMVYEEQIKLDDFLSAIDFIP